MNKIYALILFAICAGSLPANATVINYTFSAVHQVELDTTGGGSAIPLAEADWLLDGASVLSGSFSYDNSLPVFGSFGAFTTYFPAVTGLSASVGGHAVSSDNMVALVANDNDFGGGPIDMLILNALISNPAFGLVEFSLDGFGLVAMNITFSDFSATKFSDESLPDFLETDGFNFAGIDLKFENVSSQARTIRFLPMVLARSSVPEPGLAGLLGLGVFGMIAMGKRRRWSGRSW